MQLDADQPWLMSSPVLHGPCTPQSFSMTRSNYGVFLVSVASKQALPTFANHHHLEPNHYSCGPKQVIQFGSKHAKHF